MSQKFKKCNLIAINLGSRAIISYKIERWIKKQRKEKKFHSWWEDKRDNQKRWMRRVNLKKWWWIWNKEYMSYKINKPKTILLSHPFYNN